MLHYWYVAKNWQASFINERCCLCLSSVVMNNHTWYNSEGLRLWVNSRYITSLHSVHHHFRTVIFIYVGRLVSVLEFASHLSGSMDFQVLLLELVEAHNHGPGLLSRTWFGPECTMSPIELQWGCQHVFPQYVDQEFRGKTMLAKWPWLPQVFQWEGYTVCFFPPGQ